MNRREFLSMLAVQGLAIRFGLDAAPTSSSKKKTLILLELKGGNDGLNTVIPVHDKNYQALRPNLGLSTSETLDIGEKSLHLHPSLKNFAKLYKKGDLAIVQGLGYPEPNRSHFRSIDIWETASDSDEYLDQGWMARLLENQKNQFEGYDLDGLVLGNDDLGPLLGHYDSTLILANPERFLKQAGRVRKRKKELSKGNPALAHIYKVKEELMLAARDLQERMKTAPEIPVKFPKGQHGKAAEMISKLLASGLRPAVMKITLGGFDTHSNQLKKHANLLKILDESISSLYEALQAVGIAQDVVIASYSEFGRRVKENGSKGTDHGTAAPHFVLATGVNGGLHGKTPNLENLDRGDLKFTTHFRSYYQALASECFSLKAFPSTSETLNLFS